MATAAGDAFKEFLALVRNIDKLSDGQAKVTLEEECEDEDESTIVFLLSVSPNDGHYKGATIKFRVCVTIDYPTEAPRVECLNSVYHPNIDVSNNGKPSPICVNLIGEDWEPEVGLDGCVIAVLFLFYHPNQDDALSTVFSGATIDEEEFAANVKASIRGEDVEGFTFDKLVNDDDLKDENGETVPKANENATIVDVPPTEENDVNQPLEDVSNKTPVVLTDANANTNDGAVVDAKTDAVTATAPEADPLPSQIDKTNISTESEDTDMEQKIGLETVSPQTMKLDVPIVLREYLLKETRPLEIFSYDWRNVAFSFCHLLKWLYRNVKKNKRNERGARAIDCS